MCHGSPAHNTRKEDPAPEAHGAKPSRSGSIGKLRLCVKMRRPESREVLVLVLVSAASADTVFQDIADYPATKCKSDDTTIDMDRG